MNNLNQQEIKAIETRYAGCHFRSRLEARWAVFFDEMAIPWQYEPEGYELGNGRYLPDFLLTDCGTFIEVRGDRSRVDTTWLQETALQLPMMPLADLRRVERGPLLMLLGEIPRPKSYGDWGWLGFSPTTADPGRYGFGTYHKNRRPWWLDGADLADGDALEPTNDLYEYNDAQIAYRSARSARFEHGQSGAT